MVGLTPAGVATEIDMLDLVTFERCVVGSAYGSRNPIVLIPRIFELYRQGRLPLDSLVGETYELESVNDAFNASRSASSGGRPVLRIAVGPAGGDGW